VRNNADQARFNAVFKSCSPTDRKQASLIEGKIVHSPDGDAEQAIGGEAANLPRVVS
jgi:hypothetical protein